MLALAWVGGEIGTTGGSEYGTKPTNARLWLARARDLRLQEVKLMAERLGTDRLQLCLLGGDAHIEQTCDGYKLLGPSTAVIGSLSNEGGGDKQARGLVTGRA